MIVFGRLVFHPPNANLHFLPSLFRIFFFFPLLSLTMFQHEEFHTTPSTSSLPLPPPCLLFLHLHTIPLHPSHPSIHPSLELVEVLEAREHDLLGGLLDLAGEEDLVEDGVDLVEVEDEVELAHVAEEGVQHLDEEVDRLQVRQLVVVGVDARAEEKPRVPPVHDLVVPELHEVRLVLLVSRRYEAVDLFLGGRGGFRQLVRSFVLVWVRFLLLLLLKQSGVGKRYICM